MKKKIISLLLACAGMSLVSCTLEPPTLKHQIATVLDNDYHGFSAIITDAGPVMKVALHPKQIDAAGREGRGITDMVTTKKYETRKERDDREALANLVGLGASLTAMGSSYAGQQITVKRYSTGTYYTMEQPILAGYGPYLKGQKGKLLQYRRTPGIFVFQPNN